jgi:hypothetical protein
VVGRACIVDLERIALAAQGAALTIDCGSQTTGADNGRVFIGLQQ